MSEEAPEIRLIRETLEGVLHPSTASTVFFEAIQEFGGTLPDTHSTIVQMVRGPLLRGLTARLGDAYAVNVLTHIEELLAALQPAADAPPPERPKRRRRRLSDEEIAAIDMAWPEGPTTTSAAPVPAQSDVPAESAPPVGSVPPDRGLSDEKPETARERRFSMQPDRHELPTQDIVLSADILPVYILGSSEAFGESLRAVVGPQAMSAVVASTLETLENRLAQIPPGLVIVDASQFPAIEPADLVAQLRPLPRQVVRAVWGADLPYGQAMLESASGDPVSLTPFDRREGIEPLIDVIRSRRA